MRLKRLELFGFKSFADRTSFEFGEDTLTGVVGPNGCGKSNVVDAVRWALGETRPTSMRGGEMTDVIFKGSQSRPALSVAEVTLTLDNASGTLAGHGSEVAITRRVFQSGEGEYLIDGEKLRLKDVREMLFDTGLGSRGYSVLEQGRIDAVLSANPLERRRIFEEAAGISRYRQRRVETELRLKRVADDLARLDDLVGELATRVRSLKLQAGKAERWTAARDEWSAARLRHARHGLWIHGKSLAEIEQAAAGLEQRLAALREERARAEEERTLRERERAVLSAALERASGEASRVTAESRAADERMAGLRQRASEARAAAAEEARRAGELERALAERRAEAAALAARVAELERGARAAHEGARARAAELAGLEQRARELRATLEQQGDALLGLIGRRTAADNKSAALEGALAQAAERDLRHAARVAAARQAVDAQRSAETDLEARAAAAAERFRRHEAARRELAQAMADAAAEAQRAEAGKKALELERAALASRIEVLLDRERDLEELSAGGKRALEAAGEAGGPCAAEELAGLLADHLRTDTAHAPALDAALGQRGSALVAEDRAAAERVVAWLAAREAGSAGLVLPGALAPRAPRALPLGDPRVLGRLADHVRCERRFEPLREALLADVLLARDLSAALDLVAEHPELRFATAAGAIVDAAGVSGGHHALTQGAVGRRSSAEELGQRVAGLTRSIEELEARRAELVQRRIALQRDWERSSQELEQLRGARMQAESELSTARARAADQETLFGTLELEARTAGESVRRMRAELAAAQAEREHAEAGHAEQRAASAELEAERQALDARREALGRAEAEARAAAAEARAQHEGEARRQQDLARVLDEYGREAVRAARLAGEHAAAAAKAEQESEQLALHSGELLEARAAAERELASLRAALERGSGGMAQAEGRESALSHELEELSGRLAGLRLEQQRERLAREEILRRAAEDLQLGEAELLAGFEPEAQLDAPGALELLEAEARELKQRLERIGPVNTEAVAELEETGGRLAFLEKQRADLLRSRDLLAETIREIDGESKRLFVETFEQVRVNFQRIFRQLFGGGKADVALQEGVDALESGVDIVARPPGRELLPIGLLSGGQRTLTALALLFAVFEARPSPFCVLDEVDAALDDVNVGRFLAMLDGYRATTQFVVVTHNKVTMAACQRLYGVTMETKGVSRQVSVELGDAELWAETQAGNAGADRPGALRTVELQPQAPRGNGNGHGQGDRQGDAAEAELDAERARPA